MTNPSLPSEAVERFFPRDEFTFTRDRAIKLASDALAALRTAPTPDPNCGHDPNCSVWAVGGCTCAAPTPADDHIADAGKMVAEGVVELFTLDQIEEAYEAWSAGDVPTRFPAMMRESGWFMAGKQSRTDCPAADLIASLQAEIADLKTALQATAEAAATHLKTAGKRQAEIAALKVDISSAAMGASLKLLRATYEKARCDDEGVACCVRCNAMFVVNRIEHARALLNKEPSE